MCRGCAPVRAAYSPAAAPVTPPAPRPPRWGAGALLCLRRPVCAQARAVPALRLRAPAPWRGLCRRPRGCWTRPHPVRLPLSRYPVRRARTAAAARCGDIRSCGGLQLRGLPVRNPRCLAVALRLALSASPSARLSHTPLPHLYTSLSRPHAANVIGYHLPPELHSGVDPRQGSPVLSWLPPSDAAASTNSYPMANRIRCMTCATDLHTDERDKPNSAAISFCGMPSRK